MLSLRAIPYLFIDYPEWQKRKMHVLYAALSLVSAFLNQQGFLGIYIGIFHQEKYLKKKLVLLRTELSGSSL